jgi:hypothetical protein
VWPTKRLVTPPWPTILETDKRGTTRMVKSLLSAGRCDNAAPPRKGLAVKKGLALLEKERMGKRKADLPHLLSRSLTRGGIFSCD